MMPRERGLDYTPDADGYSFDDTASGEAAQASFHRLASGYPQQEPEDIHHLADVITGIRDSTFADMELRKLDFTHFKQRKRERLQLNGTG